MGFVEGLALQADCINTLSTIPIPRQTAEVEEQDDQKTSEDKKVGDVAGRVGAERVWWRSEDEERAEPLGRDEAAWVEC